jgi:hypothetical protein
MPVDTVPNTFPYRPSGGYTPEELWGGAAPGRDETPDGGTQETKDRLKKIGIEAAEQVLDVLRQKVYPQDPREKDPTRGDRDFIPTITIAGSPRKLTTAGWVVVIVLGGLLLVGIFKEGIRA